MPESGMTIPDDTLAELTCYKLQWPAGEEGRYLLRSLLYLLTRGRFWASDTGSIKDAQSMGWRVFDANWPLLACGNGTSDNGTSDNGTSDNGSDFQDILSGVGAAWEDEEMPCIDISGLLRIQNGVLQARNSCCEWVTIGAMDAPVSEYPADVVGGQLPAEQDYSACGRAYAVSDAIFRVVDAVWDNKYTLPWLTIHAVETDAGMNLTGSGVLSCQAQAVTTDALFDTGDVSDVTLRKKFVCKLAAQFAATGDKLGDAEWDAIKAACTGFSSVVDIFLNNLYLYVTTLAIGRSRLSALAQLGAVNNAQDCECPPDALQFIPEAATWAYFWDFKKNGQQYFLLADDDGNHGSFVEGVGWLGTEGAYNYQAGFAVYDGAGAGDVRIMWARIEYDVITNPENFTPIGGGIGWRNLQAGANYIAQTHPTPARSYIDVYGDMAWPSGLLTIMDPYQNGQDWCNLAYTRLWLAGYGTPPWATEFENLVG